MNCVTITGTVDEHLQTGPVTSIKLAVPRWGPAGQEPGVVYVLVRIVGSIDIKDGDLIGLTGWIEDSGQRFEVECAPHMVTVLKR
jgi:hypothetical protein